MNVEQRDFYTISDLALKVHLSRKTIWAWVKAGKLRSTRYGAQHRITESDWQECLLKFNQK